MRILEREQHERVLVALDEHENITEAYSKLAPSGDGWVVEGVEDYGNFAYFNYHRKIHPTK